MRSGGKWVVGSGTRPTTAKKFFKFLDLDSRGVYACRPRESVQDGAGAGRGGQRGAAPLCQGSVADLDPPEPRLFGPPESFYH